MDKEVTVPAEARLQGLGHRKPRVRDNNYDVPICRNLWIFIQLDVEDSMRKYLSCHR